MQTVENDWWNYVSNPVFENNLGKPGITHEMSEVAYASMAAKGDSAVATMMVQNIASVINAYYPLQRVRRISLLTWTLAKQRGLNYRLILEALRPSVTSITLDTASPTLLDSNPTQTSS